MNYYDEIAALDTLHEHGVDVETLMLWGYNTAPASIKHHLNVTGGLLEHSLNMGDALYELTEDRGIQFGHKRSLTIVSLLHDLCKVKLYENKNGIWVRTEAQGHGELSVKLAKIVLPDLTEEEELCIRFHMGAFIPGDIKGYTDAIRQYQTVLWTHTADMVAANIMEIDS